MYKMLNEEVSEYEKNKVEELGFELEEEESTQ